MNRARGLACRLLRFGCIAVAVFLAACAPDSADVDNTAQHVAAGATVFADNCAVCHGSNGRAPALSGIKSLSPAERADRIRNHPDAGRISDRLTSIQILNLVNLLNSVAPGESLPTGAESQVFVEECGSCHGPGGRGPSFIELSNVPDDQLEARLRNHPVAGTVPQRLPASDLGILIAFLESD